MMFDDVIHSQESNFFLKTEIVKKLSLVITMLRKLLHFSSDFNTTLETGQ